MRRFAVFSRYNVLAGRQQHWHYGLARQYLIALPFIMLALIHSVWWMIMPLLGGLARVAKTIWMRREGRGVLWFVNPVQFLGVALMIAVIDVATFVGWTQAIRLRYQGHRVASDAERTRDGK